ncbi:MAG: cytochrome c biogenesis protein CcsA [Planctomycetota bacterium]|jgi:ABC-type uncharacterized transport system permease subunit
MLAQTFHEFSNGEMGSFATIALHFAMGGYAIAGVLAISAMLFPGKVNSKWADAAGALSTGALLAFFVVRFIGAGTAPLQSLFGIISLTALFISLAYFVIQRSRKMPALASFAFPAVALLFLAAMAVGASATRESSEPISSPLLIVHIVSIALAFGMFFLATVAAVMFLILESSLKKRKDPEYLRSFPPLEALRSLVNKAVLSGLPLLTFGLLLGFFALPAVDWSGIHHNPKIVTSLTLWLILGLVTVARKVGWLHGRRHYYMVLVGFLFLLFTYVGLGVWGHRKASENNTALRETQTQCSDLPYLV